MDQHDSPMINRYQVGMELRRYRLAAGETTTTAATKSGVTQSYVNKLEKGHKRISPRNVLALMSIYGATRDETDKLVELAKLADQREWWEESYADTAPDWFARYVSLESAADEIWAHESGRVYGPFQTEDYMRALTLATRPTITPAELDRSVGFRTERQSRLAANPKRLRVILDEAVLRRMVGGRTVIRGQLRRFLEIAEMPDVTLQVCPFDAGAHPLIGEAFALLNFPVDSGLSVVYQEYTGGALYLDKKPNIDLFATRFEMTRRTAHSPAKSRDLVVTVLSEV